MKNKNIAEQVYIQYVDFVKEIHISLAKFDFTINKYLVFDFFFKDLMDHPEKSQAKNQWAADLLKMK